MIDWWLVIVDMPDERPSPVRTQDHLHSRFPTEALAERLRDRLETFGGRHQIVDLATTGGCCPSCHEELVRLPKNMPGGKSVATP